jgi:PEP-CTERM motif-containing protein
MKKMAAILAGLMMMAAGSAWAIPTLQLTDGINTVTVADGDVVFDANPAVGAVTYVGNVGANWWLNVATGITKPAQGTAFIPFMDLNSINLSAGAGTLQILFSETGFVSNPSVTGFNTDVGGTTQGTFSLDSYYDAGNVLFGTAGVLASLGPFPAVAFAGSETNSAATGIPDNLYSLTLGATINHTGSGATSFDAQLTPVPEPGTIVLLGAGLLGLGFYGRRRMQK